jgi:hypothetical protein
MTSGALRPSLRSRSRFAGFGSVLLAALGASGAFAGSALLALALVVAAGFAGGAFFATGMAGLGRVGRAATMRSSCLASAWERRSAARGSVSSGVSLTT